MPKILVSAVAPTVRKLRTGKKISQEELAEKASLDRTYISGVERGVRNITLDSLESIVEALDIDLNGFLDELKQSI